MNDWETERYYKNLLRFDIKNVLKSNKLFDEQLTFHAHLMFFTKEAIFIMLFVEKKMTPFCNGHVANFRFIGRYNEKQIKQFARNSFQDVLLFCTCDDIEIPEIGSLFGSF